MLRAPPPHPPPRPERRKLPRRKPAKKKRNSGASRHTLGRAARPSRTTTAAAVQRPPPRLDDIMRVHLEYGRTGLDVELPDQNVVGCLQYRPMEPLADPHAAVRASLERPSGTPPLAELARGRRSACVVISERDPPGAQSGRSAADPRYDSKRRAFRAVRFSSSWPRGCIARTWATSWSRWLGRWHADAQRLLAENMHIAVQRPVGDEGMVMVRRADDDRLDTLLLQALPPVVVGLGAGEKPGAPPSCADR